MSLKISKVNKYLSLIFLLIISINIFFAIAVFNFLERTGTLTSHPIANYYDKILCRDINYYLECLFDNDVDECSKGIAGLFRYGYKNPEDIRCFKPMLLKNNKYRERLGIAYNQRLNYYLNILSNIESGNNYFKKFDEKLYKKISQ